MAGVFDGAEVLVYVNMSEATAASTTRGTTNSALKVTADELGPSGNDITFAMVNPGNDGVLGVTVVGEAITVSLATGATGTITSTANQVIAAINAHPAAKLLVTASLPATSDGTGVVTASAVAALTGGAVAGTADYQPVARQQGADLEDSMDEIDASSKGDRWAITLPGRQSGSFDLEALYTFEDSTQARLRRAYQNREEILVRIVIPADVTGGTQATIEEARCRLTGFSRSFPDSDVATISAPVALQENWRTVQS
jgi:predicted secreted protein